MPSERAIYYRMSSDETFCRAIARAREAQQDFEADHCIKMADDATPEDWQVVKLRIWARQWRAGKLAPKKYGDKLELAGDKENPLHLAISGLKDNLGKKLDRISRRDGAGDTEDNP